MSFEATRAVLKELDGEIKDLLTCALCHQLDPKKALHVGQTCSHQICDGCYKKSEWSDKCMVETCNAKSGAVINDKNGAVLFDFVQQMNSIIGNISSTEQVPKVQIQNPKPTTSNSSATEDTIKFDDVDDSENKVPEKKLQETKLPAKRGRKSSGGSRKKPAAKPKKTNQIKTKEQMTSKQATSTEKRTPASKKPLDKKSLNKRNKKGETPLHAACCKVKIV